MSATPSRRHVLKAGAWAAPAVVLASAAPAYATSNGGAVLPAPAPLRVCKDVPHQLIWSTAAMRGAGSTRTAVARSSAPVPAGTSVTEVAVTLKSTFVGNMSGLNNRNGKNMTVTGHEVGNLGTVGLELYQGISTSRARAEATDRHLDAQVLEVVFDRPVSGLSFTITDIDGAVDQFADRVSVSGATYTETHARTVSGSGSTDDPWTGPASNVSHQTSAEGNVKVTFTQTVTAFSLRFWNAEDGRWWLGTNNVLKQNGAQAIFLSNLSFYASTCV